MTQRTLTEHGIKTASNRLRISEHEYRAQIAAGNKWCSGHKRFCPREDFGPAIWRTDGLNTRCRAADRAISSAYQRRRRLRSVMEDGCG